MGSILPPLDVRSKGALGAMMKRIKKGPLTIVLVYADWCGHCHHFMPHFDAAAKNSNRSIQAVKVNDTMVNEMNQVLKKNNQQVKEINVDGYPSVLLVGPDGNQVTTVEPVKDTKVMTEVMNQSAQMANEAGLNTKVNNKMNTLPTTDEVEVTTNAEMNTSLGANNRKSGPNINTLKANVPDFIANSMGENKGVSVAMNKPNRAIINKVNNTVNNTVSNTVNKVNNHTSSMKVMEEDAEQQASLYSPPSNGPSLAIPPVTTDNDLESIREPASMKGGSLYAAMSQSAYTLAAPAALLATAALMMRRKTRSKRKRTHKKHHKRG